VEASLRLTVGIADGWEFEIRPLELLPGFSLKINIKN